MNRNRRNLIKNSAAVVAAAGVVGTGTALAKEKSKKKVHYSGPKPEKTPLFSGAVSYGSLLFIAGKGAHFPGDIKAHTKHVLDELEKNLVKAGSSMDKVLKVNVYLNDLKDYIAMNSVYATANWGDTPPVRTTVAPAGGIPGDSLVEIDMIAYI